VSHDEEEEKMKICVSSEEAEHMDQNEIENSSSFHQEDDEGGMSFPEHYIDEEICMEDTENRKESSQSSAPAGEASSSSNDSIHSTEVPTTSDNEESFPYYSIPLAAEQIFDYERDATNRSSSADLELPALAKTIKEHMYTFQSLVVQSTFELYHNIMKAVRNSSDYELRQVNEETWQHLFCQIFSDYWDYKKARSVFRRGAEIHHYHLWKHINFSVEETKQLETFQRSTRTECVNAVNEVRKVLNRSLKKVCGISTDGFECCIELDSNLEEFIVDYKTKCKQGEESNVKTALDGLERASSCSFGVKLRYVSSSQYNIKVFMLSDQCTNLKLIFLCSAGVYGRDGGAEYRGSINAV